mmetsp:Transcript_44191/g.73328  ORF Transcript_44191/g.73328 Transcript_44191/m.73328 type:complete len:213 (-) Transcript_44191:968-1606(-)
MAFAACAMARASALWPAMPLAEPPLPDAEEVASRSRTGITTSKRCSRTRWRLTAGAAAAAGAATAPVLAGLVAAVAAAATSCMMLRRRPVCCRAVCAACVARCTPTCGCAGRASAARRRSGQIIRMAATSGATASSVANLRNARRARRGYKVEASAILTPGRANPMRKPNHTSNSPEKSATAPMIKSGIARESDRDSSLAYSALGVSAPLRL